MAITTGLALGGAVDQINTRKQLGIARGDLALRQATAEADQRQALQSDLEDRISSTFETTKERVNTLIENGVDPSDARVQKLVGTMKQDVVELAKAGQMAGLSINPRVVGRQFDALLVQPTQEERLGQIENKAAAESRGTAQGKPQTTARVVTGDTALGQRLGIPQGESARVEFDIVNERLANPRVAGGFGGGGTNVTVNAGPNEFAKEMAESDVKFRTNFIERGAQAVTDERNLSQMADLLSQGIQTGATQPFVTTIQAVAADLGVSIDDAAASIGIESLSDLDGKEEFDRLSKQVMIDGFDKFKGNLNTQEVRLAIDAFANLGKSEEANIEAVASLLAGAKLAKERAAKATEAVTQEQIRALQKETFNEDVSRFKELKDKLAKDIREQRGQTSPQTGGLEVSPEDEQLIQDLLKEE